MSETTETPGTQGADEGKRVIRGRVHLFEISGIKINVDYSWLIVFVLVLWSLSAGYFPLYYPNYATQLYWFAGLVGTLLFFSSILVHELSHSLTAVRSGIQIPEITLFIFGGIARLSQEPTSAVTELKIAVAGPLSSFALAGIFWAIAGALQAHAQTLIVAVFEYLAWINLALAIFNLVPGYPLDGGRILRAVIWWRTGSVARATKWASDIGKGFAWALMIFGGIQIFTGALIGGLWLLFIGMFLRGVAAAGYQEVMMKQSLEGVRVKEVLVENVVSTAPDLHLDQLIDKFFLRYGHGGFPVVQDGRPVGLVSLSDIKDISPEERGTKTVREVMSPLSDGLEIDPDASLVEALKKMTQQGAGRLLVMDRDRMAGMITKTGLLRFLEIKRILEE
ncbi:MAG: site-2 protease family protein [Desulfomonile tiedjei]|nr:site-2 protease family protein [Desulfomonile tiedjei]